MHARKLLVLILSVTFVTSCTVSRVKESASLPNVLIIGDSISIGYTKPLQTILKGKAQVFHNSKNALDTATGVKNLDKWLGTNKWDVIHFNHGLHDMIQGYRGKNGRYVATHSGKSFIPIDQYKSNLEKIVQRLKRTGASLIFATTTPIPAGTRLWKKGYEKEYNKVAAEIMKRNKIEINDLHAFVVPRQRWFQSPGNVHFLGNVHFNANGSQALAYEVMKHILRGIDQTKNPPDKK